MFDKNTYFIKYPDELGKEQVVSGEATSKIDAEELFYRKFGNYIINSIESIRDISKDISSKMMMHVEKAFT